MVGDQDVDDAGCGGDEIHGGLAATEPVRGLVPVIDRWPELVAQRLQRVGCLGSNAAAGLDVKDDVDVVGWRTVSIPRWMP